MGVHKGGGDQLSCCIEHHLRLYGQDVETQYLEQSADGHSRLVRVFNEGVPGEYNWYEDLWLPVTDGAIQLPEDASYLWVIKRYPAGKRHIISTFTKDCASVAC